MLRRNGIGCRAPLGVSLYVVRPLRSSRGKVVELVLVCVNYLLPCRWQNGLGHFFLPYELLVEVGQFFRKGWLVWWLKLLLTQFRHVNLLEEVVAQNFVSAVLGSQALVLVLVEELADEVLGVF